MNPAENYILEKPEPFRGILMALRSMIIGSSDSVEEAFKWKLPFYSVNKKMYCFLNFRKNYVDLGIPYGIHLKKNTSYLIDGENRKMLRSLRFYNLKDVDYELIMDVLTETLENLKSR